MHQSTQQAAEKAQADGHRQQQHEEQQRPERLALDSVLRGLQVLIDTTLIFRIKATGHVGPRQVDAGDCAKATVLAQGLDNE